MESVFAKRPRKPRSSSLAATPTCTPTRHSAASRFPVFKVIGFVNAAAFDLAFARFCGMPIDDETATPLAPAAEPPKLARQAKGKTF